MTAEFPGPGDYTQCPHCDVSLLGNPIPESIAENYSGTHWREEVGHEIRGVYDGILFWSCRACGRPFHRWPVDSFQYRAALPYMRQMDGHRKLRDIGTDPARDEVATWATSLAAGCPASEVPEHVMAEIATRTGLRVRDIEVTYAEQ